MNLKEMTIQEKIVLLERLLSKTNMDLNYSLSVKWGNDKESSIQAMRIYIQNVKELFMSGRINTLDYEQREITINRYHSLLDNELCKFPEFYNNLEQSSSPKL